MNLGFIYRQKCKDHSERKSNFVQNKNSFALSNFLTWFTLAYFLKNLFIYIVTLGCGSVSSENCSYFELNPVVQSSGPCAAQICKQSGVCQVIKIIEQNFDEKCKNQLWHWITSCWKDKGKLWAGYGQAMDRVNVWFGGERSK